MYRIHFRILAAWKLNAPFDISQIIRGVARESSQNPAVPPPAVVEKGLLTAVADGSALTKMRLLGHR